MGLIRFAIENPVKITVGVILLVLFGVLSIFDMGVQLTPDVDRPVIVVSTTWVGASPQEIEREIVERQEEKLKNVSNLKKMSSTCRANGSTIKLEFPVNVDKDTAFRDVSDKLRQVSNYPEEVEQPTVSMTDSNMAQTIAWMILYDENGQDISHLKTYMEDHVKPLLERADGISEVPIYGGREREMQIIVDPYRLAARGLTVRDVERALRRQNENISAGTIQQGKRDFIYRTLGEYEDMNQIGDTVIVYRDGGPVLIRDVATIVDGFKKPVSFVRSKGRAVMAMPARRATGANVIKAMNNLKEQVKIVNTDVLNPMGLGLELTQIYDETQYIWSAIFLVLKNIVVGGILAIIVLLLFLRSFSATAIVAGTIPISVIGSFLVITYFDRSLNVVLLAGMAFAVGMVVDNAIVVLENIYRHHSLGKGRIEAAMDGAKEVWGAILASTLTTMAVFIPVITIQEEAGQLFKDIAIAITSAVGLSLIVSILVIPPLASKFLRASKAKVQGEKQWRLAEWISSMVASINQSVNRRLAVVIGISATAVIGSILLMPSTSYLPSGNKNLIFGFLLSPPGYSIEEYRQMAMIVEDGDPNDPTDGIRPYWEAELGSPEAAQLQTVDLKLGKDGSSVRTVVPPPMGNFFFVSFGGGAFMGCTSKEPTHVKPLVDVMTRAGSRVPGVFTMFNQSSLFRSGGLGGGNSVDVEVRGVDLDLVVNAASLIQRKLMEAGYSYPRSDPPNYDLGRPEIQLIPDRAKAADVGLDVRDIGFILRTCVDGAYVGEFNDHGDKIDLTIKIKGTEDASMDKISQLPIYTPSGNVVTLASAVDFHRTTAPQQISRIEEMAAVTLSVIAKEGVPLQDMIRDLEDNILSPLKKSGMISPEIITSLAGTAGKLTQTRRALMGDFRGLVNHPRIFGLPVYISMGLICLLAIAIVLFSFMWFGPQIAIRVLAISVIVIVVGFFAMNPQFLLMVFQSRAILALLITYLLMAALFESFAYPLVIMFSVPLAMVGGFIALRIIHEVSLYDINSPIQHLDVLTMLGFVILIGIVVNNSILIVHQALNNMRNESMKADEAVRQSVRTRTRPIFMSALTTIFGMFPLVVMTGAGSELYRGLGSVVLGGLLVSTVFTLVVVPAMFTLFIDLQLKIESMIRESTHTKSASGLSTGAISTSTSHPRSPE